MSLALLWLATSSLLLLGLLGIFVPGLPGIGLVFGGILFFAFFTDFAVISVPAVITLGMIAAVALLANWAGAAAGARLGGGGYRTMAGAVLGTLVGLAGGPLGLIIGAIAGAMIGAIWEGKSVGAAGRAALFTLGGIFGAAVAQFVLAVGIILAFLVIVLL